MMVSILTPTYNRGSKLKKIYNSLLNQTLQKFEWIVVDDGSTDDTRSIVNKLIKEAKIKIKYIYKENGGKHTALNVGTKEAKCELLLVLDSDDYLSKNAVEEVIKYWDKYKKNKKICGMTFLRKISNPIYKEKPFDECVSNMIEFKYNKGNLIDMCEVIRTDILKKYPYPVYKGEKFLSEVIVTGKIAKKYDMVYIPKEIYCAEYLDDGLSKNWLKLVVNSPLGARANSKNFMSKDFKFSIRVKNCIEFNVFSIIAKKPSVKDSLMKIWSIIFWLPSFLIAHYLKWKYLKKG